jgi:formamidopyrimidine-DNA glycosylase
LDKHLARRKVLRCQSLRDDIFAELFTGKQVERVFCKGKHIFLEFEGGLFLHNHLLTRGTWRKIDGQLLFLPPNCWIALYVGPFTICNLGGQMLKVVNRGDVDKQLEALGPDAMDEPFSEQKITEQLMGQRLPIAEALLDQSVLAGVGNIAKKVLFVAGIDPRAKVSELDDAQLPKLLAAIHDTLWASFNSGGRWDCRVYRKAGRACSRCGKTIRLIKQPPSRRATYFCPACQQ